MAFIFYFPVTLTMDVVNDCQCIRNLSSDEARMSVELDIAVDNNAHDHELQLQKVGKTSIPIPAHSDENNLNSTSINVQLQSQHVQNSDLNHAPSVQITGTLSTPVFEQLQPNVKPLSLEVIQYHNQKSTTIENENIKCSKRCRMMCHPCYDMKSVEIKHDRVDSDMKNVADYALRVKLVPEAFRLLFYVFFGCLILIGVIVTSIWGNVDYDTDPIVQRFGTVNLCLFWDYPPFTYFGAFTGVFIIFLMFIYEFFDWFRIYDSFKHNEDNGIITKRIYYTYTCCTIYEILALAFFIQIFATQPSENIIVHSLPYFILLSGMWTMAFKTAIFMHKMQLLDKKDNRNPNNNKNWKYWLLYLYIILLLWTILGKIFIGVPNLFGARLWERDGYQWTSTYAEFNGQSFNFFVFICPVLLYFFIAPRLSKIEIVINRDRIRTYTAS